MAIYRLPAIALIHVDHGLAPQPVGVPRYEHRIASGELREAVADGPILFRGVEKVHEHVLRPDAGAFAE